MNLEFAWSIACLIEGVVVFCLGYRGIINRHKLSAVLFLLLTTFSWINVRFSQHNSIVYGFLEGLLNENNN